MEQKNLTDEITALTLRHVAEARKDILNMVAEVVAEVACPQCAERLSQLLRAAAVAFEVK